MRRIAVLLVLSACKPGSVETDLDTDLDSDTETDTDTDSGTDPAPSATIVFPPSSATVADTLVVRGTAASERTILGVQVAGIDATSADGFATWRAPVPLTLGDNPVSVSVETESGIAADLAAVVVTRAADWDHLSRGDAGRFGEVFDGLYTGAENIAWDAEGRRLLVIDDWGDGAYSIDPETGDHTTLSYSEAGDLHRGAGPELSSPREGDYLPDTMLVEDSGSLYTIDLPSGDRAPFGDFESPISANDVVARDGDVLILSYDDASVWSVDAAGVRTLFSGDGTGGGKELYYPTSMTLDAAHDRLLVTQQYQGELAAIDLATGDRTAFSPSTSAGPSFDDTTRITCGPDEAYLFEDSGTIVDRRLFAIDLDTGARRDLLLEGDGMDVIPMAGLATYEHGIFLLTGYALFVYDPVEQEKVVVSR